MTAPVSSWSRPLTAQHAPPSRSALRLYAAWTLAKGGPDDALPAQHLGPWAWPLSTRPGKSEEKQARASAALISCGLLCHFWIAHPIILFKRPSTSPSQKSLICPGPGPGSFPAIHFPAVRLRSTRLLPFRTSTVPPLPSSMPSCGPCPPLDSTELN